jgi:hypothetical protein
VVPYTTHLKFIGFSEHAFCRPLRRKSPKDSLPGRLLAVWQFVPFTQKPGPAVPSKRSAELCRGDGLPCFVRFWSSLHRVRQTPATGRRAVAKRYSCNAVMAFSSVQGLLSSREARDLRCFLMPVFGRSVFTHGSVHHNASETSTGLDGGAFLLNVAHGTAPAMTVKGKEMMSFCWLSTYACCSSASSSVLPFAE